MKRPSKRWIATLAILGGTLVSAPNVVHADTFTPMPSPPSVHIDSVDTQGTALIDGMQPGSVRSSETYSTVATISTNATLDAIDTVKMCWYKASESDSNCTTRNPQKSFEMVWTESNATIAGTDGFTVSPQSDETEVRYQNNGSFVDTPGVSTEYDQDKQSMAITFSYKVSSAMLAGNDWNVVVTAKYKTESVCPIGDFPGGCPQSYDLDGSDTNEGKKVLYYGEVTTAETSDLSYGFLIAEGDASSPQTYDTFTYKVNADSDYALSATKFQRTNGADDQLSLITSGSPTADEVLLQCSALREVGSAKNVPETGTSTENLGITLSPTIEDGDSDGTISCTLKYGGGANVALATFSNTMTLSVGEIK